MKTFLALIPFFIALPIVVCAAIWQGNQTERWGAFPELAVCAKRLDQVPLQVGTWKGTLGDKLDERTRKAAEAEGDTSIVYVNDVTKERVKVFIVCGRLMGVMKHRPDRCYPAHGYKESGERSQYSVVTGTDDEKGPKAQFQTAAYSRDGQADARLFWSWSSDGFWKAPDDLRSDFRRTIPVFKIHFENEVTDPKQSLDKTPSVDLIKVLIPELSRVLFPDYKPPKTANSSADTGS
jgi:hypothetical protein